MIGRPPRVNRAGFGPVYSVPSAFALMNAASAAVSRIFGSRNSFAFPPLSYRAITFSSVASLPSCMYGPEVTSARRPGVFHAPMSAGFLCPVGWAANRPSSSGVSTPSAAPTPRL